jgi:hypothetical protein
MEPNTSGVKTWQWVITAIVVIALIVLGIFVFANREDSAKNEDMTHDQTIGAGNRIVLTDQFPGNIVYVSTVELTKGGFVAIHKDDAGKPGAIIGTLYFEPGVRPGSVNLTEKTVEGGKYYAVLYTDDGDKKFDAVKDVPLTDSTGNPIMKMFKATVNLPEDKG